MHRPYRILFDKIPNSSATSLYDVPLLRYYGTASFLNDDVYRFPCFEFGVDILSSFVVEDHMSIHMASHMATKMSLSNFYYHDKIILQTKTFFLWFL